MLFVAVTSPLPFDGEAAAIRRLFDCGLDLLHLRRPATAVAVSARTIPAVDGTATGDSPDAAAADSCRRLLDSLPYDVLRRVVVHDYFDLARHYPLHGIHLTGRHPDVPPWFDRQRGLSLSASCHTLDEVTRRLSVADYVFLSPIFDSLSKPGYRAAFTDDELTAAARRGIINERVVALGGCSAVTIPRLRRWHFGGAALLGELWRDTSADHYLSLRRLLS